MVEFVDCPCSGGTLDKLIQPAILAVLSEGPSHGYRIAEKIGEIPDFVGERPDVSGIYRFLKGMEAKGLVVSSWDTPSHGNAKRRYTITPSGRECLAQWIETLNRQLTAISALLKTTRAAVARKSPRRAAACCKPSRAARAKA